MDWLLGIGLSERDDGAIRFAEWLRSHDRSDQRVQALHVVDPHIVRAAKAGANYAQLRDDATAAVREPIRGADFVDLLEVVLDEWPDAALTRVATDANADAVIVGRRAGAYEPPHVRLGRVARRMIRQLGRAAVVVPPDFRPQECEPEILLATDLDDSSAGAARFAAELAKASSTRVTILHVHLNLVSRGAPYLSPAALGEVGPQMREESLAGVRAWADSNGLETAQVLVRDGDAVPCILTAARELRPSVIVCGSRQAGITERVFTSTVGSTVAAHARQPVAVVPGDWQPRLRGAASMDHAGRK